MTFDPDAGVQVIATIESQPLCDRIIAFLLEHDGAMDTIEGVASCWVGSDEVAVRPALDCLVSAGVIVTQELSSGTYFRLTPNPDIRKWLRVNQRRFLEAHQPLPGNGSEIGRCGSEYSG